MLNDKNLDEKGVLLSGAVVGDVNTEYDVPLMNMEIPYKNLTIVKSDDIMVYFLKTIMINLVAKL